MNEDVSRFLVGSTRITPKQACTQSKGLKTPEVFVWVGREGRWELLEPDQVRRMWVGSSLCGTMLRDYFKLSQSEYHSVLVDLNRKKGLAGIYKRGKSFVIVVELPRRRSYEDMLIGGAAIGALATAGALVNKAVRGRPPVEAPLVTPSGAPRNTSPVTRTQTPSPQLVQAQAEIQRLQKDNERLEKYYKNRGAEAATKFAKLLEVYGEVMRTIPEMNAISMHGERDQKRIEQLRENLHKLSAESQVGEINDRNALDEMATQTYALHDRIAVLIQLMLTTSESPGKKMMQVAKEIRRPYMNRDAETHNIAKSTELDYFIHNEIRKNRHANRNAVNHFALGSL